MSLPAPAMRMRKFEQLVALHPSPLAGMVLEFEVSS